MVLTFRVFEGEGVGCRVSVSDACACNGERAASARQIYLLPADSRGALEIQDPHSPDMWPKSDRAS